MFDPIVEVEPIEQADREYLHAHGYDVGEYIGAGISGQVFRGVCNAIATKTYEIRKEDQHLYPSNQIWRTPRGGKIYWERELTARTCAIKRVKGANIGNIMNVAVILMKLSHPNIAEIYTTITTDQNNSYIIMEYMNGNNLEHFVDTYFTENKRFTASEVKTMLSELIEGLGYLHINDITHGDINLANVMFHLEDPSLPERRQIKYIDFDLARVSPNVDPMTGVNPNKSIDVQRLALVFRGILSVCNLYETYPFFLNDLTLITSQMYQGFYPTLDQLSYYVIPRLQFLPSPPAQPPPDDELQSLIESSSDSGSKTRYDCNTM